MAKLHVYLQRILYGWSRRALVGRVGALTVGACVFGAAGMAPLVDEPAPPAQQVIERTLTVPDLATQLEVLSAQQETAQFYQTITARAGDTLATLFARLGVNDDDAFNFIRTNEKARAALTFKPGRRFTAVTAEDGSLETLYMLPTEQDATELSVQRVGDTFRVVHDAAQFERRVEMRAGEIKTTLFAAADTAELPEQVTAQVINLFSTQIDFGRDLQRGDRFHVVYETLWQNGTAVKTGRILAAELKVAGVQHQVIWFEDPNTRQSGYFDMKGHSLKSGFLKAPLSYSRVSSGFAMRSHPVHGNWAQHKGIDFSASTGTPILASSDGVVDFIGQQNGFGNVVFLKHEAGYSTVYAHMSRFGNALHKGSRVQQGDVIGFVGATGWATGPHLHYEVRRNNISINPVTVSAPVTAGLRGPALQKFQTVANSMQHRFALLSAPESNMQLAMN